MLYIVQNLPVVSLRLQVIISKWGLFMKILLIFTGGTIGSTENGGFISPDEKKVYKLVSMYKERAEKNKDSNVLFDIITPYQELSENINCENLRLLACCLKNIQKDKYNGIIITHGTDTIQYTSAFTGYIMQDLNVPVVFVSSNYVLEDPRSNGLDNFYYAVRFIRQENRSGVFVSYCNSGSSPKIHYATRLIMHQAYSDALYSVCGMYYGYFDGDKFIYRDKKDLHLESMYKNVFQEYISSTSKASGSGLSKILAVHPYPGMKYILPLAGTKAVLHYTYHSGTLCSKADGLEEFADYTRANKIPVFITGAGNGADYESMKCYKKLGFYVLPPASPEAMYIKLWLCTISNRKTDEIVKIMNTPAAADIVNVNNMP